MLMETVLLITKPTKLHLPSTSRSSRRASKAAVSTWTELKKRPEVSLHTKSSTDAIVEALRLWDIPGTYLEFPRVLQQLLRVLSLWRLTSSRFLSSVHVNTAALLARLEDRLVLGSCSFVGLVIKRTVPSTQATPSAIGITRNNRTDAVFHSIINRNYSKWRHYQATDVSKHVLYGSFIAMSSYLS